MMKRYQPALLQSLTAFFIFTSALTHHVNGQLKTVGKKCPDAERQSLDKIDHTAFDALLKKYVNVDGQVDYRAWKKSDDDLARLNTYLNGLSKGEPKLRCQQEARLAYWINAYNAVTLAGILNVYPTSSIRNHTKKLGYNIWTDLELLVADGKINLEDIEHKILRKMNEPRIHFAIVCASIGCPRLLNEAYTADKMEQQLSTNTTDFFSRSNNLRFDSSKNELQLSAILKWFGADFGADQTTQIRNVAKYFPTEIQKRVRRGGYSVSFQDYDWGLNAQP